ncbi:MAG TPA: hypothetical protein VLG67_01950 [Candidatus Saccharimonadales bacterium]|nr:hypothetical protein [Candidatus Saccharimonadales bacterium]
MERRDRSPGKEPEALPRIQIEDKWNHSRQKRIFRIDAEKLTRLAMHDFGFTLKDVARTKLTIDSSSRFDSFYNPTIGAEEIYHHADPIVDPPGFMSQEQLDDLVPDYLPPGTPINILAAHALRYGLAIKKMYLDHSTDALDARKQARRALTGTAIGGAMSFYLIKNGVEPTGVLTGLGSAGLALKTEISRSKRKVSYDYAQLSDEAELLQLPSSDQKTIDEWASVIILDEAA